MSFIQASPVNLIRHDRASQPGTEGDSNLSSNITARLAVDRRTRTQAYSIRHDSYLAGGYIDETPSGLFSDEHDEMPNSKTVVVYKDGRPAASIRFCILDTDPTLTGWSDIPASRIFPDEVKGLLDNVSASTPSAHPRAVEFNRLVRHPDFATDRELVFVLFRLGSFMVLHHEADISLMCVRRNHMPFYRRAFKLDNVAGPRRYPGVKFETNLMACARAKYEAVRRDVPIFNYSSSTAGGYDALFKGETVRVFEAA